MPFGLFWKTLAAFSTTLLVLGVALALHYDSLPKDNRPAERLARSLVSLIERDVEAGGLPAALRDQERLAPLVRREIRVAPASEAERRQPETYYSRLATAPDGQTYLVTFRFAEGDFLQRLPWRTIWGSMVAALVFSVAFAFSLSWPIRSLRDGFRKLADGRLDVEMGRAVMARRDEFSDLARDFNRMTLRLRALVGARDRLLHDVSHELRSPLTRLQLAIGLARQDPALLETSIARVEQEALKLERLVDELLTLARAESGVEPSEEFFEPVAAIAEVIEDSRLEADAKQVTIDFAAANEDDDGAPVAGPAGLLQRAFENILRNAIRFSPEGGRIRVDATFRDASGDYHIRVADEGPGVDPALLDTLLDPFVRSGGAGTGLGLAIADRAIRALGGTLSCGNGAQGGFVAEIRLDAASDEAARDLSH